MGRRRHGNRLKAQICRILVLRQQWHQTVNTKGSELLIILLSLLSVFYGV